MTSTFQKGDQVTVDGDRGIIVKVLGTDKYRVEFENGDVEDYGASYIKLVEDDTTARKFSRPEKPIGVAKKFSKTMAELTILAKTIVDADLKNLIKVGWLDSSLRLTADGEEAVMAHYLSENKAAFGKMAEEALKERKKDRDCK